MENIKNEMKTKMDKTVSAFKQELSRLRTGRATPALLDGVKVEYYGALTPLSQMANISIPDPKLIVIQPWDASATSAIEKAIIKSDLGFNPQTDGKVIRVPVPSLTDERRKDMVKHIKKLAEESRVSVRNIRRQANDGIKSKEKAKEISEDDSRKYQDDIQKQTNEFITQIDKVVETKEKEILEG